MFKVLRAVNLRVNFMFIATKEFVDSEKEGEGFRNSPERPENIVNLVSSELHVTMQLRNECLFFWVHGEARKRFSCDLFVPRYDSFPMNPEKKDTHSLYLQCVQQRPLSKILREKF